MNNHFTQRVSDILAYSKEEAGRLHNSRIAPEHLVLGLIRNGEGKAFEALCNMNVTMQQLKHELESILMNDTDDSEEYDNIRFDEKASNVLRQSILEAKMMKSSKSDSEHILLAILKMKDLYACKLLEGHDFTYEKLYNELKQNANSNKQNFISSYYGDEDEYEDDEPNKGDRISFKINGHDQSDSSTKYLDLYGSDITCAAMQGKIDPVIGREKEIERITQILGRRKKNNPILIGEPGVGKSAIVEGLALNIVNRKVSRVLFDKRIISLDLTSVVAGTKFRGQFEERINNILKELKENPNIIVFIDEIHTIVGAGSALGSQDAANMLKPVLTKGELQCIGATTPDEYKKSIENDGALERRFQKVIVEPTTEEETLLILNNIKDKYEEHHNVKYTDKAIEACVKLSGKYIHDRFFPDKAIDAMDEAGSRAFIGNATVSKDIEEQEKHIEEIRQKKSEAVKLQNFELAASYRDKEKNASAMLEEMNEKWSSEQKKHKLTIDEEQIEQVISDISNIPVQKIAQDESTKLINMKKELLEHVIGQDKAVETVVKAIQRNRIGLKDPKKPIGIFMFLGPTGVGKTYLAKELANIMFGSEDAMIRLDMSEYMEKFTLSRLIGSPPGYVGYEEGGQLTEKVKRKPYSIILLDEIEKAHQDVFNILLQLMDDGRLTDSNGRTIYFNNTIIIMTSNIGSKQLKEFGNGIGFTANMNKNIKEHSNSIITKSLNKSFAPEFLNRIDEIINFDQLEEDSIIKIIDLELDKLIKRIKEIGYQLIVDDESKKFMAHKGYDIQYGARPLKRTIQKYIEDKLSEAILAGDVKTGDTVYTVFDKENETINIISK